MASYCSNCGAPDQTGRFCSTCGQPLAGETPGPVPDPAPAPPAPSGGYDPDAEGERTRIRPVAPVPPVTEPPATAPTDVTRPPTYAPEPPAPTPAPAAASYGPPPPAATQQFPDPGFGPPPVTPAPMPMTGPGPVPQAGGTVNPFVGWPWSDYARDAGAALLFLLTFAMPWDFSDSRGTNYNHGGERWWVIISLLLGLASVAVPYVAKARLVPTITPAQWRLIKLGLNGPLVLSVLVGFLIELFSLGSSHLLRGGFGSGMAMALTAVALTAQPRAAEEDPARPDAEDATWLLAARLAVLAALGQFVVFYVLWFLHGISSHGAVFSPPLRFFLLTFSTLVIGAATVGYPAWRTVRGSVDGYRVLAAVGLTMVTVALFSLASDGDGLWSWPPAEKWDGVPIGATIDGHIVFVPGGGLLFLGAAAALALSRAAGRRMAGTDPVTGWTETIRASLYVTLATSGIFVICLLLDLLERHDFRFSVVVLVVLTLAIGGAAGFATTLLGDLRQHRIVLLAVAAAVFVLGWVVIGVVNGSNLGSPNVLGASSAADYKRRLGGTWYADSGWVTAAWIVLPVLVAFALTVPPSIRAALGPIAPPQPAQPWTSGAPGTPGAPGAPGGPPATGPSAYPPAGPTPGQWGPPPQQ